MCGKLTTTAVSMSNKLEFDRWKRHSVTWFFENEQFSRVNELYSIILNTITFCWHSISYLSRSWHTMNSFVLLKPFFVWYFRQSKTQYIFAYIFVHRIPDNDDLPITDVTANIMWWIRNARINSQRWIMRCPQVQYCIARNSTNNYFYSVYVIANQIFLF